jgi:hypothetical protein
MFLSFFTPPIGEKYGDGNKKLVDHLLPIYFNLLLDGVSLVRTKAAACTAVMMKAVRESLNLVLRRKMIRLTNQGIYVSSMKVIMISMTMSMPIFEPV